MFTGDVKSPEGIKDVHSRILQVIQIQKHIRNTLESWESNGKSWGELGSKLWPRMSLKRSGLNEKPTAHTDTAHTHTHNYAFYIK